MQHLAIDLEGFNFVTRETLAGKPVIFRCNRDFLYYALTFYHPERFSRATGGAMALENRLRGHKAPSWLIWTMFHVAHLPRLLKKYDLQLYLNDKPINSWFSMVLDF